MKHILLFLYISISIYALENIETKEIVDSESKNSMQTWIDGGFGLKPYRVNYLLPYGYRTNGIYDNYSPTGDYKNIEAELQVSLKLNVGSGLFGLKEKYYLSYTHKAFWQIYVKSSPFRETTYNPEAFVVFPILDKDSFLSMKSIKLALAHRSNGQGSREEIVKTTQNYNTGNQSRSINYIYSEFSFQHNTLVTEFTVWIPFYETIHGTDNPDIMEYIGYTSLKFNYFLHKHMFTLMGRGNFETLQGALEATYSYPLIKDTYFYTKFFTGYGESLIDYNNHITKFSIGFSFSR